MAPSTTLPSDRGQALWAQVSRRQLACPAASLNSTQRCWNSSRGTAAPACSRELNSAGYQKFCRLAGSPVSAPRLREAPGEDWACCCGCGC